MILYDSIVDGVHHKLGTSGFLYRSNKLMYDSATQSLWSTLLGKPVIGALVGQELRLSRRSVVTTSWGAWRALHPDTSVLDISTGYERDYGEGVAYADYFASAELMFDVKPRDQRLANKAEVLGLVFDEHAGEPSLALSIAFLATHPIYHGRLGEQRFVTLNDSSGAVRVYGLPPAAEALGQPEFQIQEWKSDGSLRDSTGASWSLHEAYLESAAGKRLARLPAHRAFWFGWYAAHPSTQLVLE